MSEFIASNGIEVDSFGRAVFPLPGNSSTPEALKQALKEYFQHERDEELGRWRSTELPQWVVYPDERNRREGRMIDESTGEWNHAHPDYNWPHRPDLNTVNQEFLAAHPEKKPWHNAKAGEVWILSIDDLVYGGAYVAGDFHFRAADHSIKIDDPRITSARKIWPESD